MFFICLYFRKIFFISFLRKNITNIFLVGKNTIDCRCAPSSFSSGSLYTTVLQILFCFQTTKTFQIQIIDKKYNFCLLFYKHKASILVFCISKKIGVFELDITNFDIFVFLLTFSLCHSSGNRDNPAHPLVNWIYLFWLKKDVDYQAFKFIYTNEKGKCVSTNSANRFSNDILNLTGSKIFYHVIESISSKNFVRCLFCIGSPSFQPEWFWIKFL